MKSITTMKYIIYLKKIDDIDLKSLIFLIDDSESCDIDDIVPEEIVMHLSLSNNISNVKYDTQILIKYLIHNFTTFRNNKKLKAIVKSMINPSNLPFFGYFMFLYDNIIDIDIKYDKINTETNYIYFMDINYL